jgi:hypothetical protein
MITIKKVYIWKIQPVMHYEQHDIEALKNRQSEAKVPLPLAKPKVSRIPSKEKPSGSCIPNWIGEVSSWVGIVASGWNWTSSLICSSEVNTIEYWTKYPLPAIWNRLPNYCKKILVICISLHPIEEIQIIQGFLAMCFVKDNWSMSARGMLIHHGGGLV